ncbi:nuclear transport factor 2 family protein [Glycomyces tenuis]|uniref:nuclear transport factor 2 family protein n=1 Tax=Glycomyces tenuis TaxID=58116 RepID=UPI000407DCF1|nr:nuclear transport factor 2 family protein [Glycomyces tenuis]
MADARHPSRGARPRADSSLGAARPGLVDFLVQNTHPGLIEIDGDTATGRTYMSEVGRGTDGRSALNCAIYHDRYERTADGWKFAERTYEIRYLDETPLTGAVPGRDDH